jgi:hypothetical protein
MCSRLIAPPCAETQDVVEIDEDVSSNDTLAMVTRAGGNKRTRREGQLDGVTCLMRGISHAIVEGFVGYATLDTGERIYSGPAAPEQGLGEIEAVVRDALAEKGRDGRDL